jgi:hypothetical protein
MPSSLTISLMLSTDEVRLIVITGSIECLNFSA